MSYGEADAVTSTVVDSYLDFLHDSYLIEDLPGWDAPIRSRKHLRTKPKRYYVDPSLAMAALGADEQALLGDLQTFGMMFENLCLRDLRILIDADPLFLGSTIGFYRDDTGLEADVIIQLPDGRWGAMEIKLSENKVASGVASLLRLRERVAANAAAQIPVPSFLAVLVGRTSYARRTPEGVYVVPITSLGA
jgi:predicted AAA+ superfamily ATPase